MIPDRSDGGPSVLENGLRGTYTRSLCGDVVRTHQKCWLIITWACLFYDARVKDSPLDAPNMSKIIVASMALSVALTGR